MTVIAAAAVVPGVAAVVYLVVALVAPDRFS